MNYRTHLLSAPVRAVARLTSGAVLAQAIAVGAQPIIARLFTPADYGAVALYSSTVAIASSVATGRYDAAIVLPPETEDGRGQALALARLAILICLSVSAAALLFFLVTDLVGATTWLHELGPWVYAVPIGVLATGALQILSNVANRYREYKPLSRVGAIAKITAASTQILSGLARAGQGGMIAGALLGQVVGAVTLVPAWLRARARAATRAPLRVVARNYNDFPRLNMAFSLLSTLSWNVQVLVISANYPTSEVGQYSMAYGLLSLPAALFLTSVSQVFLRELSARSGDRLAARKLAARTVQVLAATSLLPFLLLGAFTPEVFRIVFGPQWDVAGEIARAMLPLIWCRFLSSTLTATMAVFRRQGVLLAWQAVTLAFTVGAYAGGASMGWSVVTSTWVVSAVVGPLYLLLIPIAFRVIGGRAPAVPNRDD